LANGNGKGLLTTLAIAGGVISVITGTFAITKGVEAARVVSVERAVTELRLDYTGVKMEILTRLRAIDESLKELKESVR
jgi:hypothetical protein